MESDKGITERVDASMRQHRAKDHGPRSVGPAELKEGLGTLAEHGNAHHSPNFAEDSAVVKKADFDATTFLYATNDDTPQAKTPAEVMVILSGDAGAAFDWNGQNIQKINSIYLTEQAAADGDTASYGQVWVKTATPNELWFTDDAGTDTQLGAIASTTVAGKVELAIASEINTGTDSGRAMPVDQFVASDRNIRFVTFRLIEAATDCAVDTTIGGDWVCPFTGTLLQADGTPDWCSANVDTAGVDGGPMVVDVHKGGATVMATNKLEVETAEKSSTDATTQPDLTVTAVTAGDIFTFDIDSGIHTTTAAKGLSVTLAIRMT